MICRIWSHIKFIQKQNKLIPLGPNTTSLVALTTPIATGTTTTRYKEKYHGYFSVTPLLWLLC